MKYKLIAVDMDGTLLNDQCVITPRTVAAINKAVSRGVIFTISTGRPIQGVEQYIEQLQLKAPVITYNGAMIVSSDTGKTLFSKTIEPRDALKILNCGLELGVTMCIWANNQLYCNGLNERVKFYESISGVAAVAADDYATLAESGITKILWYDEVDVIADIQQKLSKNSFEKVTFCTSRPYFLEFFHSEVSKADAMDKIGQLCGVKREEMIAVGDGFNDLPMIDYAGLGVAMANAPDEVQKRADYVTQHSNNDDGIAEVIEKFVL